MNKNIKRHFGLTCFAYMALGIGITVQRLGLKAGLDLYTTIGIFVGCMLFWVIIVFTSMEKVKEVLYKKPQKTTVYFDFENEADDKNSIQQAHDKAQYE